MVRDQKRRRQSYRAKKVHVTKKSYTEVSSGTWNTNKLECVCVCACVCMFLIFKLRNEMTVSHLQIAFIILQFDVFTDHPRSDLEPD